MGKKTYHGNPYSHEEHSRESLGHPGECDWCGQERKNLYKFDDTKGWFCNKGCWRSFHEG